MLGGYQDWLRTILCYYREVILRIAAELTVT